MPAEQSFWVCAAIGFFADDVQTTCSTCGAAIVHRPTAPADATKICARCAVNLLAADKRARLGVTENTIREAELYLTSTRGVQ
jgi:hypothetical protein